MLGSSKVARMNGPVFWPSTVVKLLVAPVTGRSVTVNEAKSVVVEPPSSTTVVVTV